jgi:hypothetical protein
VVRGLPIPIIFLRDKKTNLKTLEPEREVVDGQQRIRTLLSYIDPTLLNDFKETRDSFEVKSSHNKELAGKKFSQLSVEIQQRILDYEFSVHILPSHVDDRDVLQIFARMNATGVKLNFQELRNADYSGEFKMSMYKLANEQLPQWRNWKIFSEYNIARMQEVELVSEFSLIMIKKLKGKSQRALNAIYKEFESSFPMRTEVERRFRIVMETIDDKLGKELRFLPFSKKTLFYSLFAFLYDVRFGIGSSLKKTQPKPISSQKIAYIKLVGQKIDDFIAPKKVLESVARRTTHSDSRRNIIRYLHGKLND